MSQGKRKGDTQGTHEAGLRDGVFQSVRNFVDLHGMQPKGVNLLPEDVFARGSEPVDRLRAQQARAGELADEGDARRLI